MSDTKYNGYTDFPTWKVFHETLSNITFDKYVTPEELKEISLDVVLFGFKIQFGSHLVEEFARVFIESADFQDIADSINNDIR